MLLFIAVKSGNGIGKSLLTFHRPCARYILQQRKIGISGDSFPTKMRVPDYPWKIPYRQGISNIPFNPVRSGTISGSGLIYHIMLRRSDRKLLYSAFISGAALRLGLPGLGNLILLIWETTRPMLQEVFLAELRIVITVVSLVVFLIATYFMYEIYIKGFRKGKKGLFIVLVGIIGGFLLVSLLIGSLEELIPASSLSLVPGW
jgi:hypothetical protein